MFENIQQMLEMLAKQISAGVELGVLLTRSYQQTEETQKAETAGTILTEILNLREELDRFILAKEGLELSEVKAKIDSIVSRLEKAVTALANLRDL